MIDIYDKILNRQNEIFQDYIADCRSNLTKEDYEKHVEFIASLPLSQEQKERLEATTMLYHFIAENALERFEEAEDRCNTAMRKLFIRLSPEDQKGIIRRCLNSVLGQGLEDVKSELLRDAPDALPMRVIEA